MKLSISQLLFLSILSAGLIFPYSLLQQILERLQANTDAHSLYLLESGLVEIRVKLESFTRC